MKEPERRNDFARLVLEQAWQLHQQPHNHASTPPAASA
jgi:CRISPR-associated endonuclease/helicase Cas3